MKKFVSIALLVSPLIVISGLIFGGGYFLVVGIINFIKSETPTPKLQQQQIVPPFQIPPNFGGPNGNQINRDNEDLEEGEFVSKIDLRRFRQQIGETNYHFKGIYRPAKLPTLPGFEWFTPIDGKIPKVYQSLQNEPAFLNTYYRTKIFWNLTKKRRKMSLTPIIIYLHQQFNTFTSEELRLISWLNEEGFRVVCPTLRGEFGNGGEKEYFYGEINDVLQALRETRLHAPIPTNNIYLLGVGEGATLATLANCYGVLPVKAVITIGGSLKVSPEMIRNNIDLSQFKSREDQITQLTAEAMGRSPLYFLNFISKSLYHFGSGISEHYLQATRNNLIPNDPRIHQPALLMETPPGIFQYSYDTSRNDHLKLIQLIAARIQQDGTTPITNIRFTQEEILNLDHHAP